MAEQPRDGSATPPDEPIEVPITDVLDLHPFQPREINSVVREYLEVAWESGLRQIRIIHGRGIGMQRKAVRTILERDPRVIRFGDAPPGAGGWGATWVEMGPTPGAGAGIDEERADGG